MVYVAVKGKDSLVSDNYYKDGMEINQTIEQDQLAQKLNLQPRVSISDDGLVSLFFSSKELPKQPFVTLHILHPTLSERDISVKLLPTQTGFIGNIPAGTSGRRYLDLYAFDSSWRIREEVVLPLDNYLLKPKR